VSKENRNEIPILAFKHIFPVYELKGSAANIEVDHNLGAMVEAKKF